MGWSRRGVLLGCCTLAGCAPGPARTDAPMVSPVASAPSTPASTAPSPTPSVPPSPLPSAPPTRDAIVAEFSGRSPRVWGTDVPGVVSRVGDQHVYLTFDACGGPAGSAVDADLIATLRRHRVAATLFLNRRWITANSTLASELAHDPLFRVESHGARHVPLSVSGRSVYGITGTASAGEVFDELTAADEWFLSTLHRRPSWFRPGTAHVDDVAVAIAGRLGYRLAGFAVNGDAGATASRAQVAAAFGSVRAGAIVLAHMNQPKGQTAEGVADALPRLLDRGVTFGTLPNPG